jgi:hypothetical protein
MAFAFNIGGDDIDLDEDDVPEMTKDNDRSATVQHQATAPVEIYVVGDKYPRDGPTLSLVSPEDPEDHDPAMSLIAWDVSPLPRYS